MKFIALTCLWFFSFSFVSSSRFQLRWVTLTSAPSPRCGLWILIFVSVLYWRQWGEYKHWGDDWLVPSCVPHLIGCRFGWHVPPRPLCVRHRGSVVGLSAQCVRWEWADGLPLETHKAQLKVRMSKSHVTPDPDQTLFFFHIAAVYQTHVRVCFQVFFV